MVQCLKAISKMKKTLLILILILILSSCTWITGAGPTFLAGTRISIPEGTPKFQQGFKTGCSSMLHDRGNVYYRTFNKHYFDPEMIDDTEYMNGYKRGHSYCFQYSIAGNGFFAGGPDLYIFSYKDYTPFDNGMGKGNIDDTVKYGNLDWGTGQELGGLNGVVSGVSKSLSTNTSVSGAYGGGGVFGSHILWGTPSRGQIFGGE